jgi:hypothetical protein
VVSAPCQRPSLRSGPVVFDVARVARSLLLLTIPKIDEEPHFMSSDISRSNPAARS